MKIENILATKGMIVHTIAPDKTLKDAVDALAQHNIGALVVADATGKPIGILSERDIARAAARSENVWSQHVAEVMTKNLVTASPQDDVQAVGNTMTQRRFRHMPILDQGKMVGIVSIGDVLKAQLDEYQGKIETLQTQILAQ